MSTKLADPAARSLRVIAEMAIERRFGGRILAGHCCSLRLQEEDEQRRTIEAVARAGLSVVSLPMCNMFLQDRKAGRTPRWRGVTALHELKAAGVNVMIASDNVRDPFHAYGDHDMLEVWREGVRILHLDYPFADWASVVRESPARAMGLRDGGIPPRRAGGYDPGAGARFHRADGARPRRSHGASQWPGAQRGAAGLCRHRRPGRPLAMSLAYDIAGFRERIGSIKCEDNPVLVKQKSRDFYWYSPVLKRELEAVTADIVVSPKTESEVATVLAAAHEFAIPVTARGGGTGNYGQAMPLTGGVLLNLIEMNKVLSISTGRVVCEPGAILRDVDKAAAASGQELRMYPSTRATASVAGFVAGGSGGVGSITWGGLRDFGNVLRLRVLTMEAEPRALELTGEDLHKAVHAYGTNGVITEVEMPLTASYDWVEAIVGFDSFDAATAYALALGEQDGILKKLVTVVAAPAPHDYFLRHRVLVPPGKSVVLAMIAPHALDAFETFTRPFSAAQVLFVSSRAAAETLKGLPPIYELAWNHTTLRALRVDPAMTYLQARYPEDGA